MSTPPTGSPESQAQQPSYVCPCCDARWSLRDVRYCYACRDCGGGLITVLEEQSVRSNEGISHTSRLAARVESHATTRGPTDEQPKERPLA